MKLAFYIFNKLQSKILKYVVKLLAHNVCTYVHMRFKPLCGI